MGTQGQAEGSRSVPAIQRSKSGTEQTPGSTSAENPSQVRDATQDTQVEGDGLGAGQAEVKLCLQLSSEDQDLACCQQPFPFLQPVGVHGSLRRPPSYYCPPSIPRYKRLLVTLHYSVIHEHLSLAQ